MLDRLFPRELSAHPGARRATLLLAFLIFVFLFLVANRAAYKGYFSDDDLDNLANGRGIQASVYLEELLTPKRSEWNFRPAAHIYYHWMDRLAGMKFPPYVGVVQAIHLVNVVLVWLILRRLRFGEFASSAGALFFGFHVATFDIYWKPMYVFDVVCGLFCLLAVLLYLEDRVVLSFLSFWLAFKAKEVVVLLPLVLLWWELRFNTAAEAGEPAEGGAGWFRRAWSGFLGEKRWIKLAPFFLVSASFGVQALMINHGRDSYYTLRFGLDDILKCVNYYSSAVFLVPYLGLVLVVLAIAISDSRLRFGLATLLLLMAPMLALPGRLFEAYLYVPLFGLAIAMAALARMRHAKPWVVLFFVLWLPFNYLGLRERRRATLAAAQENRAWVDAARTLVQNHPRVLTFFYERRPENFNVWGMSGALRLLQPNANLPILALRDPGSEKALEANGIGVLVWDPKRRTVSTLVREPGRKDAAYVKIDPETPIWQLGKGWFEREGSYRWISPVATAWVRRPAGAREFEVTLNISPLYLQLIHASELEVLLDGATVGKAQIRQPGWQTLRWNVTPKPEDKTQVEFRVTPELRLDQGHTIYGVPIGGFGFR